MRREGSEYMSFTSRPEIVRLGETIGDVNDDDFKRLQIDERLRSISTRSYAFDQQGIKVLSLFFIDKVANYRDYDRRATRGRGSTP